jgi:mono/diheme cytochrome c family protein
MTIRHSATLFAFALLTACGGGETADQAADEMPAAAPAEAPAAAMEAPSGAIDEALASEGEQLFTTRGCSGCHQMDAKLIGPALGTVTNRRSYEWITAMILHPDSMIANDPDAKALFEETGTPMVNMGATAEDARAIYEYLRSQTQ